MAQRAAREAVARYLEQVAQEATDRPRALAAGILAQALGRAARAAPSPVEFVENEVRRYAAEGGEGDDTAAEIAYEIGSLLVELRERFPDVPLALGP